MAERGQQRLAGRPGQSAVRQTTACGSIEPEPAFSRPQVTVQTSALVDDFGAMYFEVHDEEISFYFGENDDSIHVGFTDQSLLNLARLVNCAVKAMVGARAIAVPDHVKGPA